MQCQAMLWNPRWTWERRSDSQSEWAAAQNRPRREERWPFWTRGGRRELSCGDWAVWGEVGIHSTKPDLSKHFVPKSFVLYCVHDSCLSYVLNGNTWQVSFGVRRSLPPLPSSRDEQCHSKWSASVITLLLCQLLVFPFHWTCLVRWQLA